MELATVVFRTTLFYFFIVLAYRIMGKREIGQLGIIDLIVSILIAELVAISIENTKDSILLTIIPISLLVVLELVLAFVSIKSRNFRSAFGGKPSLIIYCGKINFKEMVKQRYSMDDLLLELRQREIKSIEENYILIEKQKEKADKDYEECNLKVNGITGKCTELYKRKVNEKEKLYEVLQEENFLNINEVKENVLNKNKIEELKLEVDNYNNDLAKIKGAIESVSQKINNRKLAKEEWTEIQNKKEEKESQVKELEEVKIKLQEEVKLIKEKLLEQMDLLKEKEKLDHKLALLNDLDKLFKGKKFVEFVAATRLKYVSLEASRKLKEVTNGNYGLEVDEDGKFIIRDYKNGGAGRDASTLSGGETFLASLALSLALSAEIQLKGTAPLELFFLDEGFGTLDDNLLEVVMSSLERIHNDKLKVGIISHVESIKNRVPVKLLVTPAQAGMGGSKVKIERS